MGTDFLSAAELAELTGFTVKTIYHRHSTQTGALAPILSKLGRRLGAWREDYDAWRAQQRRLPDVPRAALQGSSAQRGIECRPCAS
jgi:predicted DNA-binding transcriptional regulator AlpA